MMNNAGIAGHTFTTGIGTIVDDPYSDPRFNRDVDQQTGFLTRSLLCAPVRTPKGQVIGVLQVLNKKQGCFTQEDLELLEEMTSLSAMALIFSLFLLNPSPFCVMDEVDAPLDEFSLAAFTTLMAELKMRSQFIVITHNQRTMQRADQIHGVTMDRPGISRIISLRIPQAA